MTVVLDEFDFRKKDLTLRRHERKFDHFEEDVVEDKKNNFSSTLQKWSSSDEHRTNDEKSVKPLLPNFTFQAQHLTNSSSPHIIQNPSFGSDNALRRDDALKNYFRQNEQIHESLGGAQARSRASEKPVHGIIQPTEEVLEEYKRKYVTVSTDNFDWLNRGESAYTKHNRKNEDSSRNIHEAIYESADNFTWLRNASQSEQSNKRSVIFENSLTEPALIMNQQQNQFITRDKKQEEHRPSFNETVIHSSQLAHKDHRGHNEDDDGWVRTDMPGPSTQSHERVSMETSRSPNETYSDENGIMSLEEEEEEEEEEETGGTADERKKKKKKLKLKSSFKRKSSRKEKVSTPIGDGNDSLLVTLNGSSPIFSPSLPRRTSQTNLNNLNFTKLSANVRRSRSNVEFDDASGSRRGVRRSRSWRTNNTEADFDESYIAISGYNGLNVNQSHRSRSTVSSGSSINTSVYSSTTDRSTDTTKQTGIQHKHDRNKFATTVMLAKGWSGKIISTSKKTEQIYDYNMKISPPREATTGRHLSGLIIRNKKPFNNVKPTDDQDRAMQILYNLDRSLVSESDSKRALFKESLDWMFESQATSSSYYRESKCERAVLPDLSKCVMNKGWDEGQNMRVNFYKHLHKIIAVINKMLQDIPQKYFPFKIKPLSFQGEFEKKGKNAVDLYLVIENMAPSISLVSYILRKGLLAYVILNKEENLEEFRLFHAQNADNGIRILSASNLMLVFSYIANSKLRSRYQFTSKRRRAKIPFDAQITFKNVSKGDVQINMYFPDDDVAYDVTLQLALHVSEFPNVIDSVPDRKWPKLDDKRELIQNGVHLIAKHNINQSHSWNVNFLKTRKVLLSRCDNDNVSTTLLLTLQVVNDRVLSNRGCSGLLLPVHFIMILFWLQSKNQNKLSWTVDSLGERFLDLVIMLKRCLKQKQCLDFFFPSTNYFDSLTREQCENLYLNAEDILSNPMACLVGLHNEKVT